MDVGSALHKARIERGLFVPELSYRTRIRAEVIVAIEANDFSGCGGDVFARGHVRTLAQALEIDPDPLLEAMGAKPGATTLEPVEPGPMNIWELQERAHAPSERRIWGAVAAVALVILAVLAWRTLPGATPVEVEPLPSATTSATSTATESASADPSASVQPTDTAPTPTPPQESVATVVEGALVLQLDCTQTSWVRITNARGTLYEGTLREGDRKVLSSDTDVAVRIGNAAGVTLTVNGTAYPSLGAPGEVYTRTFRVA